ncbi:MAG: hypothetical protein O3B72_07885 [Proteobacteria bacterium]|nr:hypothetical protein [Pseudomonadota bacterium]
MEIKPGSRFKSAVCDAEVMVVKAGGEGELTCGGVPMVAEAPAERADGEASQMHGCVIGKRYINQAESIEILCIKSGDGSLYFGGEELMTKDTKKLPSTD